MRYKLSPNKPRPLDKAHVGVAPGNDAQAQSRPISRSRMSQLDALDRARRAVQPPTHKE